MVPSCRRNCGSTLGRPAILCTPQLLHRDANPHYGVDGAQQLGVHRAHCGYTNEYITKQFIASEPDARIHEGHCNVFYI
jgi:hypothetical protein